MTAKRIDVISDTHGHLSRELLQAIDGCDLLVHAGDMTSEDDYYTLSALSPLKMCLGNNDWAGEYGSDVVKKVYFDYQGLSFVLVHQRPYLADENFDVGIFGHTHVPFCEEQPNGSLLLNPGSPTFPRSSWGPTIARLMVQDGHVLSHEIIKLGVDKDDESGNKWVRSFFNW